LRAKRGALAGNREQGSNWIRRAKRLRIYARDGWRCVWCLAEVIDGRHMAALSALDNGLRLATLDHYLPRGRGGRNETDNLLTACMYCNAARGEMPALAFAALLPEPTHEVLERVLQALEAELPERERAA
jgi:5-methylcytosine-specific restriction endonuclease McrA